MQVVVEVAQQKRNNRRRRIGAAPDDAPERLADVVNQAIERNAEDRAYQAYRDYVLGYTLREIAKRCGYGSHTTAMRAIKSVREKTIVRDNRALIARQADRIEFAVATVMQAIAAWPTEDKLWAVDRLAPLLKRESELMGLDAKGDDAPADSTPKVILRGSQMQRNEGAEHANGGA